MVSLFSFIGEIVEPKSFAGLFGAAPSIALASLGLTIVSRGAANAAIECRSMLIGAVAFGCYRATVTRLLASWRMPAMRAAIGALGVWFAVAYGLWFLVLD